MFYYFHYIGPECHSSDEVALTSFDASFGFATAFIKLKPQGGWTDFRSRAWAVLDDPKSSIWAKVRGQCDR